jgi:hypothetical protein
MGQVNDGLTDLFDRFELTTTPDGVEIRPVLSAATAERIIEGEQQWADGLEFGGRDVLRDERTGALVSFGEVEEEPLFEDTELAPSVPTLVTRRPVAITPPLRTFATDSTKFAQRQL